MSQRRSARRTTVASSIASAGAATLAPVSVDDSGPSVTASKKSEKSKWSECSLLMECDDEPLTPAQKNRRVKDLENFKSQMKKLEEMAKAASSIAVNQGGSTVITNVESSVTTSTAGPAGPTVVQPTAVSSAPGIGTGYKLIMDPRTGRIVNAIYNPPGAPVVPSAAPTRPTPTPPTRIQPVVQPTKPAKAPPAKATPPPQPAPSATKVARPASIDLNRPGPAVTAKQKEFPALSVTPRASKVTQGPNRRSELDSKVKSLLVHTATKFTEWLIQQGLVPAEQTDRFGMKLNLGMYSDVKRFPNSGGYVWIPPSAPTNTNKFVSVYAGSLFEASSHSPTVILKLIYHWSCQTSINVRIRSEYG